MVTINAINLDDDSVNVIEFKDDNSAKALMFDVLLNKEFQYSYIEVNEIDEEEYEFKFFLNIHQYVYGNGFKINYED